ncbi:hypothetical protein BU16DRAFT_555308 [Lophium mytilinum]|uniref:F-box domain-containing protein n=1 Tax=Lophium mytilinum TaxID=390894 RepID=A0A6A6RIY0_9PEZI|nr:hypothetical protein BU16DRAFT_555308 [Lophium mytilinum]
MQTLSTITECDTRSTPTPEPHEKPFPFLHLPPELRLQVYEAAFQSNDPIGIVPSNGSWAVEPSYSMPSLSSRLPFALLLANKQIRAEAREIVYNVNTFALRRLVREDPKGWLCPANVASCFLRSVPFRALRSLEIHFGSVGSELAPLDGAEKQEWRGFCAALGGCTGLRALKLDMVGRLPGADCLSAGLAKPVSWIEELLEVFQKRKLQRLALRYVSECFVEDYEEEVWRVAGLLEVLRKGMLDGVEELGKKGLKEVREIVGDLAMDNMVMIECNDVCGMKMISLLEEDLTEWERCSKSYISIED